VGHPAHALADGVYVHENGDPRSPLEFRGLAAPTHADIAEVAARTAARIEKILKAHGRSLDPELGDDTPPELASRHCPRAPHSRRRSRPKG